jgi:molybdopterin-guanine dinucleotide biosynthesis protein A
VEKFKSAVILAGGKSTRMGFDKQLLELEGRKITEELIAKLKGRFSDVMVSSPTPQLYDPGQVRVIQDIYQESGPLAGIHAALLQAQSQWVFVTACDMPYLELAYLDFMMERLQEGSYAVCVTEREGGLEPFHAFYSRSALPALEDCLARGRRSVNRFIREINALIIPEAEAAPLLPGWRAFLNLNTPEEYQKYRREGRGSS